jgi:osmotically-inducible protein OsmY
MKRKYGFVLGVSVTMGMLSLEPRVMAQTDTSPSSRSSSDLPLKDETTDTAITAKVKSALTRDRDTSTAVEAIHVQTYGGIVTLTGDVASPATAEHAQTVVAQVSGVRDVVNDLKYPHPSGGGFGAKGGAAGSPGQVIVQRGRIR